MGSKKFDVGHEGTVLCIAGGDSVCASGDEKGQVILWDSERHTTGKVSAGDNDVTALCFAPNEPYLFAASGSSIARYDLRNLSSVLETLNFNTDEINELHIKQKYLGACDDSGEIKLINLTDKRCKTMKKHQNICATMAFRPNFSSEILSGGLDSKMIRWDFYKTKAMKLYDMTSFESSSDESSSYLVSPPMVHCVRCSVDGVVAAALENGTVQMFNGSSKPLVSKGAFFGHTKGVSQVHFLQPNVLISGGNDNLIIVHKFEATNEHRWRDEQVLIDQGSPINWLESWVKFPNQIIVADQSHLIGLHDVTS